MVTTTAIRKRGRVPDVLRLFWSERGAITCGKHAPYRGSDTWRWERWAPVPECAETAALICETCRSKA